MEDLLDDLDPAGTLARAESVVRRRRAVEVEDLLVAAHWADLHASDPKRAPGGRRNWDCGGDRLVQVGGEGTPLVQELCLPELAVARRVHTLSVRAVVADVLDLRHRLPRVWRRVVSLEAEPWVARKVAAMSRPLSPAAVTVVDAAVADAIAGESPSRVLEIAQAKVIEADTAAHAARLEAERRRRYVALSRADESGLRHVVARVETGDAVWVDAMVDRVAAILATRPDLRPGTPAEITRDELRAIGFGWLARPAELLELLLSASQSATPGPGPRQDLLDVLRSADLVRARPRATVYVHLHEAALAGAGGVARAEGLGPQLLEQVKALLGHAQVTLKPVIDLAERVSVNAYEFPESLKERLHLVNPGEVFPHATRTSRKVDIDHPEPFEAHGPPGQTGDHNAAPLGRTHHRAKTHLGYRARQTGPGEYVWRTPHGLHRVVDARGTHPIEESEAAALTGGDPLDRALARLLHLHRTCALA